MANNKINREIRIRFADKEAELYDYITSKRSAGGFLKDIAAVEMKRENNLIKNTQEVALEVLKLLQLGDLDLNNIKIEQKQDLIDKNTDFNSDIEDEFDD